VVSHHLAGLLRRSPRHRGCRDHALAGLLAESRGLVASRCQSWGSSGFRSSRPVARSRRHPRRCVPTPRRTPPILSRTVSPRPVPSCRSLAALSRPPGVALPLAPFNPFAASSPPSRLCSEMGPYHRAPLPTTDGLPFRGLLVPLQGPSITHTAFARFVTNSRAASADLSLFQSSALQWARSPRFRSRRSSS